jgi:hypothetical protein
MFLVVVCLYDQIPLILNQQDSLLPKPVRVFNVPGYVTVLPSPPGYPVYLQSILTSPALYSLNETSLTKVRVFFLGGGGAMKAKRRGYSPNQSR